MLKIDLVTISAEIINFLVLAVALYFLLFKPVVKRMKAQAEEKDALMESIREKESQVNQDLQTIETRLANIDSEIEIRLQKAYKEAQDESQALLKATEKEAARILQEAAFEASKHQQQEVKQLQKELVDSILMISGQVLLKTSPDIVHDNLIEDLTKEIWDLGKRDMRQVSTIRDSLSERSPTALVSAARELTPDQQRSLVRTFSALADRNVEMEIEVDPGLIAGIRVRMGDLVVENSLAMELEELKSDVVASLEENFHAEE